MSEEQYKIVDLKETLAIADKDNCKYYQNDNEHFEELCELLNKQEQLIQELKKDLKTVIEKYDCSVLHDSDWRSKLDDYKHNGQFCKKWGLDE